MVDLDTVKNIRKDLDSMLALLAKKYNGSFDVGKINYSSMTADIKIEFLANAEDGTSGEQIQFESLCRAYGFDKSQYLRRVSVKGVEYEFYGFNERARKYPCCIRSIDHSGKEMCYSAQGLLAILR